LKETLPSVTSVSNFAENFAGIEVIQGLLAYFFYFEKMKKAYAIAMLSVYLCVCRSPH
jgi:hypothetical protein